MTSSDYNCFNVLVTNSLIWKVVLFLIWKTKKKRNTALYQHSEAWSILTTFVLLHLKWKRQKHYELSIKKLLKHITHVIREVVSALPPSVSPWRQTAAASRSCPPDKRSVPDHPAVSLAGKWDPSVSPSVPPGAPSSPSQSDSRKAHVLKKMFHAHWSQKHCTVCSKCWINAGRCIFCRFYIKIDNPHCKRGIGYHTHQIPLRKACDKGEITALVGMH